ncbi:hypothetical protein KX928_14490 [Roseobacter sp. YSTF-M11]|uniref:M18 family aminopeptidase n=1 Tax=Roseobacter insulae TaxID=2859783 RepID=A0A9X1FVU5_9RHOB|nr:hypothetical protein [Roseobacter insulae]MBW4708995.1 hypothetical protein [Roseobacter insulae]
MNLHDFLDKSVTPYHSTRAACDWLRDKGFLEVDTPQPQTPGKYFTVRGGKTVFAWGVPDGPQASAFHIVSAHTDFPSLKIKSEAFFSKMGCHFLAVHPYDGPNLASWMDRDLGIAGLAYFEEEGSVKPKLLEPPLRCRTLGVPTHMKANKSEPNAQTDLHCLFDTGEALTEEDFWQTLLAGTGQEGVPLEHDLCLYDSATSSTFGKGDAFVSSARLDNLVSCFSAISALTSGDWSKGSSIPVVALFDAEEIGSGTWLGAKSPLFEKVLAGIAGGNYEAMIGRSAQISLDVAHALHPLSPDLFDSQDTPIVGSGPVAKYGIRGNYSYNSHLMAHLKMLAGAEEMNMQSFTYRADRGQGGSLGPHSSTALAVRSVDIGIPIFAMHSVREACSRADIDAATSLIGAFFKAVCPFENNLSD